MTDGTAMPASALVRSNIIIVDRRQLPREGMRRLLESCSFRVIGEGRTLQEALRALAPGARPDLLLHSCEDDAEAERELASVLAAREQFRGVKSVLVTDCVRTDVLAKAVRAGVEAILSKDISSEVLQRAIELVLLGHRTFPTDLTELLLEAAALEAEPRLPPSPPMPAVATERRSTMLSPREHQILRCLVEGLSNKMIARELDITEATVKVHIKGLLRKTRMANRTQAAIWALNHALHRTPEAAPADGMAALVTRARPEAAVDAAIAGWRPAE